MEGLESRNIEKPTTLAGAESVDKQPFVIGVARGAASGKTTVCDMIIQQLHDQRVVLVNQDSFYHNLTEEELARVHEYNFDHPDAFDSQKLLDSMENLRHDRAVDIPNYDFKSYKSKVFAARRVNPSDVIILEGILIFHDPRVRELMNMKIFVDSDADVRLSRRIRRGTVEKGRAIGAVLDQYSKFVKPAFDDFILPTKNGESMENALRACCKGIKIGKILIHREGDNGQQLIYEKLPQDISERHVFLLDPILGTGNSAVQAISLLIKKGVPESNIIFLNLMSATQGVHVVCKSFPKIKIVTSEIDIGLNEDFRVVPGVGEFGDRYFGTDDDDDNQQVVASTQLSNQSS
ncbi:Uridine kinase-like protein 4 [Hibiscus syriacus]|uniref:Uridine kinase-like protein 4 n=1 Tax=Hibiscus syriacus TaxID=106335 RepID=A0A6A2YLT0_HIBSY|nr:Uridine kinase-like protein 4 [Hibiscus syriacus]